MRKLRDILEHQDTSRRKGDWLIDGLIKNNTINLLSGEPSSGKTMFVINMLKSILDKEEFLGKKTYKVNRVLYVSTETSDEDLALRFSQIGLKNIDAIEIISNESFGQFYLEENVKDYDLVVIDVLIDFFSSFCNDNNDYTQTYNVFNEIRKSNVLSKRTWLFLHHLNKKGQILGSTALDGGQDTRMIIKMPNGRNSKLRIVDVYGKQVQTTEIKLNFEYPNMTLVNNQNDECEEKLESEIAYIIEQVISKGTIQGSSSKISSDLGLAKYGRNPITLTKFLKANEELLNRNLINLSTSKNHNGRLITLSFKDENNEA